MPNSTKQCTAGYSQRQCTASVRTDQCTDRLVYEQCTDRPVYGQSMHARGVQTVRACPWCTDRTGPTVYRTVQDRQCTGPYSLSYSAVQYSLQYSAVQSRTVQSRHAVPLRTVLPCCTTPYSLCSAVSLRTVSGLPCHSVQFCRTTPYIKVMPSHTVQSLVYCARRTVFGVLCLPYSLGMLCLPYSSIGLVQSGYFRPVWPKHCRLSTTDCSPVVHSSTSVQT